MDIHKPHAAKSWREFAVEIGTIVVGILIALALDALVETVRERRATDEAREAVRDEVATNIGWMLWKHETEAACVKARLAELSGIVAAGREGRPYAAPQWVGRSLNVPISTRRWTAAAQAGRATRLTAREQDVYGRFYFNFDTYITWQEEAQRTWATLRGVQGVKTMTPAMAWALTDALEQAKLEAYRDTRATLRAKEAAELVGIPVAPRRPSGDLEVKTPPTCVPIGADRATAVAMIGRAEEP